MLTTRRLGAGLRDQLAGPLVIGVAAVEMGDQDARVEGDHAGQSSRSRSSSPDS
jgi:hypothetical protein